MGRYSKFNSSYILKKQHQTIDGGVIIERDWVTIGERNNIGPNKKRVSYDGNFLFTENTESMAYRKAATGKWVGSYNYNDVKNASETVNKVKLNTTTDNPLVFAYYGPLYDKFEGAIIDIIKYFPGNIRFGNAPFSPIMDGYRLPDNLSLLENEFEINFISTPKDLTKYDNDLRYMSLSWQNYNIIVDGDEKNPLEITNYVVENKQTNIWDVEQVYIGDAELYKYDGKYYKYDESTGQYIDINIVESDNYFVKCGEYIKHKDHYYKWNDEDGMYRKLPIEKVCEPEVYEMFEVVFTGKSKCSDQLEHYKIHIYRIYDQVVYTNEITCHTIEIRPKKEIIEAYFDGLAGIEAIMLNRKFNPNYSFEMIVCETDSEDNVLRVKKTLNWPKDPDGYCIKINGIDFDVFVNDVLSSAENYDANFSDNIWRNMTHESIKNYDWSYERNGDENDILDNEIGSNVVCNILRLIGMELDELKMYIEGITDSNNLTYDGFLNMPDSEVVNALEMGGFDAFSTIWHQDEYVEIQESEIPENVFPNNYFTIPSPESVLDDYISVGCVGGSNGIKYYKRQSTIGDEVRLDYAFFNPEHEDDYHVFKKDPWISRNYSGYAYRKLMFAPTDVTSDYWTDRNTYDTVPTVGSRFSPRYARVYTENGFDYYEKVSNFDNDEYIHSNWFEKLDPNYFSQSVVDIDFMRRLGLSSRNIFATKGTAHGIDMVMAVFGFGRENDLNQSDYELIEPYHELIPIPFDDDFYYYEPLQGPQPGVSYGPNATFVILPLHATNDDYRFPKDIKVDDGFGGYYYFKKASKKTFDLVYEIYNSIINVSYENGEYPGFPLATMFINGKKYYIPYMSDKYDYHGELYFQSKGGWCKMSNLNSGKYDYSETVPYIKSVNTPANLLDENAFYGVGDYVYVKYPLNDVDVFNINPVHVSNYFKLVKQDVTNPESWRNIPLSGPIEFDNYLPPTDDDEFAPTHNDFINVKFIDEIIFTNVGNNPHKGNGKYDGGIDYLSYMRLPFKYSIDNANNDFVDNVNLAIAKQFVFDISSFKYSMPKLFNNAYTYVYEQLESEPNVDENYWDSTNTLSSLPEAIYPSTPEILRVSEENDTYVYFKKTKLSEETIKYFLNSKIVIMKNLNNNVLYKRYFNSIILPYLLQVIPSTTIFVLENFNECDEKIGCYFNVEAIAGGDGFGTVTGSGRYFDCDYAILTATPSENCHFVEWQKIDCKTKEVIPTEMDMSTPTIMPKIVGETCEEQICYVAIFRYNCIISIANGLNRCGEFAYSSDIVYGNIYFNGEREFTNGVEYVIDDNIQSYFFIAEPINGYHLVTWVVLDVDNNDITLDLEENDIINISGNRIDVFVKDKLCGCKFVPVFSPSSYTVSADIVCQCGDSSIIMSDPEICDPVYITLSCKESSCCNTAYVNYIVGGSGIRRKDYDTFDEPIVVNRGENISVWFLNEIDCCELYSISVGQDVFYESNVSFIAKDDVTVCGDFKANDVILKYAVACCVDEVSVIGFLDANDTSIIYKDDCRCGTDLIFAISENGCVPYYFILNDSDVTEIYKENGMVYIKIPNVNENIAITTGVDFSKLEPIFSTPVVDYGGIETEIQETCYRYSFMTDCSDCGDVCFNLIFTDSGCDCSCKYFIDKIRYECSTNNQKWLKIENCITLTEYLQFIEQNNCERLFVRAVLVYNENEFSISVIGSYPPGLSFSCTYGNNSFNILPNSSYNVQYKPSENFYVTPNYSSSCGDITNINISGCRSGESLNPTGLSTVLEPCGEISLVYTFSGYGDYTVTVAVYDEETGEPTTSYDCVTIGQGRTEFSQTVSCGSPFLLTINKNFEGCCNAITRIVYSSENNVETIIPAQNPTVFIASVTKNYDVRIYVSHKKYSVSIYYDVEKGDCNDYDVIKCLRINCIDSLNCVDVEENGVFSHSECEYLCDYNATFSKIKRCDRVYNLCCQTDFDVVDLDGYEFGLASEFDDVNKTWAAGYAPDVYSDINDLTATMTDDYVLIVKCKCAPTTIDIPSENFEIIPIDENYNEISITPEIPDCLFFGFQEICHPEEGKSCTLGVSLYAESNDCYEFKKWLLYDSVNDTYVELSSDETYDFYTCEERTVYAQFFAHEQNNIVGADIVVLEQDFSPYNQNMHSSPYSVSVLPQSQYDRDSGSCGDFTKEFRFVNDRPDLFSFQGIYYYDTFFHTYTPCFDVNVAFEYDEDENEVYTFSTQTCKSVEYRLVLVPNDYICFYNSDYFDQPNKTIKFEMGYYTLQNTLYPVSQDSEQDSMLPNITYWNGTTWTTVIYDYNTSLFTIDNVKDFLMVRISTPFLVGTKIGNYVTLVQSPFTPALGKITISVTDQNNMSGRFSISGSILCLAYGNDGYNIHNLPDFFAEEIFSRSMPNNIFGYAFKNVGAIGKNALYNMFGTSTSPSTLTQNTATDFVMFDNVTSIDTYGCYCLFASSKMSGVSFKKLQTIEQHGCQNMFNYASRIESDLIFEQLTTVGEYGCNGMFKNCDGSNTLSYGQAYSVIIRFPNLQIIYNHAFDDFFFGNQLIEGELYINGINNAYIQGNGNVFYQSFRNSGLVKADISRLVLNNGNSYVTFELCFSGTNLNMLKVGCLFDFVERTQENPNIPTLNWLDDGDLTVTPQFYCSPTCASNANTFGRNTNTVPSRWNINTISC